MSAAPDTLADDLRDSIAIGRICDALKRGDLTADTMLRMCVRSVYESGDDHEIRLWDRLVRFAEAK